ncbi:bifunctional proline dehydrogenase/L-glutamate gamma-semialdehyde dehydrogenase [Blastopirellula sp. JC732]|uniref:L-glutamate gamma-semialdehyde dehydrogenase n=1 Tax=Blastopirellula sediminis TaxID=2894196 RepID=A0A9X1SEU2_9BACT|nr:bifunctional proline dehydrogenase/L-glutamate gamma-semialdehyde dehydrogenase [Blastopirellula sediminis]MCC9609626.1 bifunctional proline dehydrogenase/L-glutamate gamma-semialdehyde dehydrogenase [Blastopirellula sediminis]MCC9627598.1 bifunctional proline dehydrogenase/L-glutamate gamma-semialdehyde dehydrogenase [Blastopirellula sediminis]
MFDTTIANRTVDLAKRLLVAANQNIRANEKKQSEQLARMMNDAAGKAFTMAMVDETFRSAKPAVQARRWRGLLRDFGLPQYFSWTDRLLLRIASAASIVAPQIVMPLIAARMRADSANVILNGEMDELRKHVRQRISQGFSINLNHLGEAVLGEEEAQNRLRVALDYLKQPEVNYLSVKISAVFSQINLTAYDQTLTAIKDRLRIIYRAAMPEGKFVNLDMEEYRDLRLTLEAFQQVLSEPEFLHYSAGIVLQAYIPDSWNALQELAAWAKERAATGGAKVKVRLVKGANMAMEDVEAELHGWHSAPYRTKAETDANYRRMMEFCVQPEHAAVLRVGVASHNLFDVALALTLREEFGTSDSVEIEMLEGMANHQARVVKEQAGGLLLYAPAVQAKDFQSAMAYLVRRLDENTSPQNFLHDLFGLTPDSDAWHEQERRFREGWEHRRDVASLSRRQLPCVDPNRAAHFMNQPDSDWTQYQTREQLDEAIANWTPALPPPAADLDAALDCAVAAAERWSAESVLQRAEILHHAGQVMQQRRFESIAEMQRTCKKAIAEADAEVSEAIDFARYYAEHYPHYPEVVGKPLGVVVITPPWNFPYAIPCGGVLAALMAGNAVLLKPAPESTDIAWLLVQQLWDAGVPRDVLQFYPCADGETGKRLITDPRVNAVVLTGAYQTARMFQSWRPSLHLFAETSGKNALVITAQADRELAVKDLVRSAFGHAGQKCSAASLAIIEAEVYDDPIFQRQLHDTAASLMVGPATDRTSVVTPVIREPESSLMRALTQLDAGESWLLKPKVSAEDPCLWSPGIRLGVKPGSWFHKTECFGPVLGLMRAENLEQAIAWQNDVDYGLTAGIHTLDESEQVRWRDSVQAGNLYINRPTTGAIVQRQPFGGWKKSSIGPGSKAGGPNYVSLFARWSDASVDVPQAKVEQNYRLAWNEYFSQEHDPSHLTGESNIFRYRPARGVLLRLPSDDPSTIARAKLAAQITGTPLEISVATKEPDADFIARLSSVGSRFEFLRTIGDVNDAVLAAAHQAGLNWIDAPLTANGYVELRFWLREQSITRTLHRYGQIIQAPSDHA